MSLILETLRKAYLMLTGYGLLEGRIKAIEEHTSVINRELGEIEVRLDKISDDVSYIRGRLDR